MKRRTVFIASLARRSVAFPQASRPPVVFAMGSEIPSAKSVRFGGPMDKLTRSERSKHMALIRSKNTKPELLVKEIVHSCGRRFRLHASAFPGKPDFVFPNQNKAIFVHGCFWQGHSCRRGRNRPSSNLAYWRSTLLRNSQRDVKNRTALLPTGLLLSRPFAGRGPRGTNHRLAIANHGSQITRR